MPAGWSERPKVSRQNGGDTEKECAAFEDWHLGVVWDYVNEWSGIQ